MTTYRRQQKIIQRIEAEFNEPVSDVLLGFADMGYSLNYTAGALGVSHDTLKRLADNLGVAFPRDARPPMSDEQKRKLAAIKRQGRRRDARLFTLGGETRHLSAWARRIGVSPSTIIKRIEHYRWPVEKALTTPSQKPTGGKLGGNRNHPWRNHSC